MPVQIGDKILKHPIIQGGMGVGISLGSLAGNVCKNGCLGVISSVGIGFKEKDYYQNSLEANKRALKKEIQKAREISQGKGILGVNIMRALTDYKEMVQFTSKQPVDAIIMGAGLPLDLPKYTTKDILLAPIVSSRRALELIIRTWKKKFSRIPDFLIVEGPKAGGHLGFDRENIEKENLKDIFLSIKDFLKEQALQIPTFVAGGISTHEDYEQALSWGATGVQIGTRFIATVECDAPEAFKKAVIDDPEIEIIKSPVGMPARAIKNNFTKKIKEQRVPTRHCINCLIPCDPKTTGFCISDALTSSALGDMENGLLFAGANAKRIDSIKTVKEVIDEMVGDKDE